MVNETFEADWSEAKMITPVLELTFYKDQEEHLEKDWNDFINRREDFTHYLVCERWEDPNKNGKIYYSLMAAKRAAGWLEGVDVPQPKVTPL